LAACGIFGPKKSNINALPGPYCGRPESTEWLIR
jgi:hypothetical protein